jgi:hypothetical protein
LQLAATGACPVEATEGDAEKFHPWNFSARCGAVQARAALHESMAYAIDSCQGILPRRQPLSKSAAA